MRPERAAREMPSRLAVAQAKDRRRPFFLSSLAVALSVACRGGLRGCGSFITLRAFQQRVYPKRRVCWRCKSSLMLPQTIPPRIHDGVGAPEPDAGKRPAHCSECLRGSKLSPSLLIMKLLLSLQVCMRCSLPKGGSLYGSSPGEDRYSQPL